MAKRAQEAQPDMITRIERGMVLLAHIISMDGEVYLPIFARLEAELEAARRQQDTMNRAQRLLETYKLKSAGTLKAIR